MTNNRIEKNNNLLKKIEMNSMKNDLIALAIMSIVLIVMIITMHPLSELTLENFAGLLGLLGYFVIKRIVDGYYARKR